MSPTALQTVLEIPWPISRGLPGATVARSLGKPESYVWARMSQLEREILEQVDRAE